MNGYGHPWYPPRRGRHGFRGAPSGRWSDVDRRDCRGAVAAAAPARRTDRSRRASAAPGLLQPPRRDAGSDQVPASRRVGRRISAGDHL